jgi:DNA helicase-2/ATP-dependent DNA helicase PcrA
MLWSALGKGEKIQVYVAQHERQEAAFVATQLLKNVQSRHLPLNEIAIFYRTNAQSRPFEDALLAHKIPYTIVGGLSFYQRKEIKDVLAFLRMIISDTDLISFLRTINLPKRGIGATTLEKWVQGAADRGIPILPFCDCLLTEGSLPPRQRQGLLNYLALIRSLRDKRGSLKIHELIAELIASSNYLSVLAEDPETEQDKKENIDELIGKALEWEEEAETPSLSRFLEELSLRSSSDEAGAGAAVQLMTLHNSKGLEFRVVFLVGLEEELFPHVNALGSPEALEEERRLCYVGMTRAKELLYLCSAVQRYMWGTLRLMRPSRFLKEIPAEFLHNLSPHLAPRSHSDSEEILPFAPGDQVIHAEFGQGIIQKAFHSSYGLAYDIYFPDADATRTIVAKFAKLRSG